MADGLLVQQEVDCHVGADSQMDLNMVNVVTQDGLSKEPLDVLIQPNQINA